MISLAFELWLFGWPACLGGLVVLALLLLWWLTRWPLKGWPTLVAILVSGAVQWWWSVKIAGWW